MAAVAPALRFSHERRQLWRRYGLTLLLGLAIAMLHSQLGSGLNPSQQWQLWRAPSDSFSALNYHLAVLPRLVIALLVGAALGLAGSLLQQMTQNPLVSPMTIGASSGAWLGLLLASSLAPSFAAAYGEWAALGGALTAVALVLLIVGRSGLSGLPLVLAGMALNLLLGAIAGGIMLILHEQSRGLFVWGAGDLTQIDWGWVQWLWPRLLIGLLALVIAPRALTLLQLGGQAAQARGMNLLPVLLVLFLLAVWLSSVAITAVGMIGFIGLLAPNLARWLGARTARDELAYSLLLGMLLLLASDALALLLNNGWFELVPTGATTALIGAPALLWLARRQLSAKDQGALQLPRGALRLSRFNLCAVIAAVLLCALLGLALSRSLAGWQLGWPTESLWSLRWPRVLAAASAGSGLAVAGLLLQRLLRNPLASPDLLGLTAGAGLAVLSSLVLFGSSLFWLLAPLTAFVGSLAVLAVLLVLGRRHRYAPAIMVLIGVALSALLGTVLQFVLSKGSSDALALLGWLSGSTYRITGAQALWLLAGVLLLSGLSVLMQRAIGLISIDDGVALSRGLNLAQARLLLLLLASLLCAWVTSLLGPTAFVGLLAPHMAAMLGARRVPSQLGLAMALGSALMMLADWLGRNLLFPLQIPVGLVASVVCGLYFMLLLLRGRWA
ncbi:Fe(3+)-hydroxamate ABC transporter permease FhuB [Pseudomonas sp. 5P_3.1_Bac2]|uniref:Fe(3+)-hydroxamate ABC transporter permease FhuB n=1 Tax=Pseudomonas sp. 5P_3.1_Bac2 TaxID=2971617 RepID=UPI0021C5A885|nr:Fe(3+)-hydroxamate ABC transporter permease FhuB [Pseudomonas sp. 5P_3.1_Bac2]MCU1719237.1 Fe(3+)-hydroxamate ABC transporter permease FhuB [Pseudomonas sp. 5P_3.1_Bac2]